MDERVSLISDDDITAAVAALRDIVENDGDPLNRLNAAQTLLKYGTATDIAGIAALR